MVLCSLSASAGGTRKDISSKPAPNTQEQQQAAVVHEEVDTQSKKFELKENVAYGPVIKNREFQLEENVAYMDQ